MKITLHVSDVDYDVLADVLLPLLEEQMGDNVPMTKLPHF